jgi:hypothetical protein
LLPSAAAAASADVTAREICQTMPKKIYALFREIYFDIVRTKTTRTKMSICRAAR